MYQNKLLGVRVRRLTAIKTCGNRVAQSVGLVRMVRRKEGALRLLNEKGLS